jgi:hypothetical protein
MSRRVLVVTLFLLAGCYRPADASLDAVGLIDGGDDVDLDGVKNTIDNCPQVANPNQHDMDRDKIGDSCDPCPVDVRTQDTDGDGVADGCDHEPNNANRIVWFQPFDGSTLPSGWSIQGAATTGFGGGGLSILATTPTYLLAPAVAASPGRLIAVFSSLAEPIASVTARVGAMTGFASMTEAYIVCDLVRTSSISSLGLFQSPPAASPTILGTASFPNALNVGDYAVGIGGAESGGICQAAKLMDIASINGDAPTVIQGTTGLRIENASVRVAWLMLVQRKP